MYDETIQRALRRLRIEPIQLPAQYLEELLVNFRSVAPKSIILTGTAGDGKTYHCREVWRAFEGDADEWDAGARVHRLQLTSGNELVVVKDLSELRLEDSASLLPTMAADIAAPSNRRFYLIAANHGQLLEKIKSAPQTPQVQAMRGAVEELLVTGRNPDPNIHLDMRDLSRAPASQLLGDVIDAVTGHRDWEQCSGCPLQADAKLCPIRENRARIRGDSDGALLRRRLTALVEISEQNGAHFPIRQLLALISNALLGHPDAPDGLMTCPSAADTVSHGTVDQASVYSNVFGENLKARRAERTEPFRKLNAFGIGAETSNRVDSLLVYGADDPALTSAYTGLVLDDVIYGATSVYARAQREYLEGQDTSARETFLRMLRSQRQRLFFTLPPEREAEFGLWDLTVFRYGGVFLNVVRCVHERQPVPKGVLAVLVRGLNRVFTGMLLQNQDEVVLAISGSHSQSKTSPLLDESISVPRMGGQEVRLEPTLNGGVVLTVRVSRDDDPGPVSLVLTPTRFEFLGRVAEGALPSSFSLECHEDLLAFKARLLSATQRRREIDGDRLGDAGEVVLRFIELGSDGRASPRRVTVRV